MKIGSGLRALILAALGVFGAATSLAADTPKRGGTLTLLVGGEDEAERAAKILEAQGYHVVISPVLE
jgi:3-hydroxyisobutyrate dehydrogenase-like beta-hydroxyacid dehydrogenase